MAALPHVIDQQAIEWARSSQAAAEARLDVLIANFETQRAEAALDRQQYEQEAASTINQLQRDLQATKEELMQVAREREASAFRMQEMSSQIALLKSQSAKLVTEISDLHVKNMCLHVQKTKLQTDWDTSSASLNSTTTGLFQKFKIQVHRLEEVMPVLQQTVSMGAKQKAGACKQVASLFRFLFIRMERVRLQDIFNEFVVKCSSPAEKAIARAAAQSAKLQMTVAELQEREKEMHEELRLMDIENEQVKEASRQEGQETQDQVARFMHMQGRLVAEQRKSCAVKQFAEHCSNELVAALHHLQIVRQEHGDLQAILMGASADLESAQAMRLECTNEKLKAFEDREVQHQIQVQKLKKHAVDAELALEDVRESGAQLLRDEAALRALHTRLCQTNASNFARVVQVEEEKGALQLAVSDLRRKEAIAHLILRDVQTSCSYLADLVFGSVGLCLSCLERS